MNYEKLVDLQNCIRGTVFRVHFTSDECVRVTQTFSEG